MPGNDETGFKPISRQSSDYSAGVPIKKRRFPLYHPPSPPPEEEVPVPGEYDSLQKEQSSPSQGLALSNASVVAGISDADKRPVSKEYKGSSDADKKPVSKEYKGSSDADKKPVSEEYKGSSDVMNVTVVQSNPNCSSVKVEEPSIVHSGSLDDMERKDKIVAAEKAARLIAIGKTKLLSSPNEALVLKLGKELYTKEKAEGKCKAEIPTVAGNTDLTLGLKEHLFPALTGQNSNQRGQNQDSLEPGSLNLSLGKEISSIQSKNDEVETNSGARRCGNRANWDLNTTMDAWEGSASEAAAAGQMPVDVFNTTDCTRDIKPLICTTGMIGTLICTTGMIGTVISSKQQSLVDSVNIAKLNLLSKPSSQRLKSFDSLDLGLSPSSFPPQVSQEPSILSGKEDSGRIFNNISLPRSVVPTGNLNRDFRTVKSEPFDESNKLDNTTTRANNMDLLLDNRTIKREFDEQCSLHNASNISTVRVVDPASTKPELFHKGNVEALKTLAGMSSQADKQMLGLSNHSSAMAIPGTALLSCPAGEPSCSTELSIAMDVGNHLEQSSCTKEAHISGELVPQEACERVQVASETAAISVGHDGKESSSSGMIGTVRAEDGNADDFEQCRLKLINEQPPDMRGSEGSVSDEEKISVIADMLEEDSYGSDYESDGNHPLPRAMDTEQDGEEEDYEDGEVREPLVHTAVEEPICEKREVERVDHGDSDNYKMDIVGQQGDDHPTSSHVEEKEAKTENPGETNNTESKDCVETVKEVFDSCDTNLACMQESLTDENLASGADIKRPIQAIRRMPLDPSGSTDCPMEQEAELSLDQTTEGIQATAATFTQGVDESVKNVDPVEKNDTAQPGMEVSAYCDDAAKDVNFFVGNRSRIINLSRATNASPPGKTRYISDRSLPSRAGRERLPDVPLEGEKLYPRGRDELYIDGSHKFSRDRHRDQSPRNSRLNFVRGRGRITGRLDTLHGGDWDSDRDFTSEFYNGPPTEFRLPRNKYASAVGDADLEYNSYNIAPDGAFIGTGRGGRKHLDDEGAIFRHMPSRRRSPGGRGGPAARGGVQMIRRVPRNVSPNRCIGEDGSEVVGMRHSEKFMRVFPDDNIDPMFTRPQPGYEGVDAHFARGGRNFSSVQRRGLPRIHPKSPMRSRSRSPVQWPSPRRRSQDGFGGHPELSHRRSPPIYRVERMRSPDRPCFTGDIMVRRNGSPPFMSRPSNDLRDINSGRDHGHPRSVIPNRSPSGRILLRNRRFDVIDPRERTDGDEYFGGPMHAGRLHELGGDPNGDERRRFGERRGPARSFRPPYNAASGESFHLNSEDGPRPFRFCPEDDPEFHERGNLRDREFDRRIKNRPGNAPRRTRSIEEQEANYRHGGQVWHDDGFDEISRVKRKRF